MLLNVGDSFGALSGSVMGACVSGGRVSSSGVWVLRCVAICVSGCYVLSGRRRIRSCCGWSSVGSGRLCAGNVSTL